MRSDEPITQQSDVSHATAGCEIHGNRITADDEAVRNVALKLLPEHDVAYDDSPLAQQHGPRYFILNKPQSCACFMDDPDHPTVLYFLDEPIAWKLHAAGYLNTGTIGLILMTDDGQRLHRITSPCHYCGRICLVTLGSSVADDTAEQSAKGVRLYNKKDLTKPAVLETITPTQVHLTISEGRYHQVKRMFVAVSNHVVELHREHIGGITLDADLVPDGYHPLTEEEIASVV